VAAGRRRSGENPRNEDAILIDLVKCIIVALFAVAMIALLWGTPL